MLAALPTVTVTAPPSPPLPPGAERHGELAGAARAGRGCRLPAVDADTAVPAAAADALCHQCLRAVSGGRDVAGRGHLHRAAAAAARRAANREIEAGAALVLDIAQNSGDAVATAATDAECKDAMRIVVARGERCGVGDGDVAARPRGAARTADGKRRRVAARRSVGDLANRADAAMTATAADALGVDGVTAAMMAE